MVYAITVLLGIVLVCVITICVMITHAMDYDPAWDDEEWERTKKRLEEEHDRYGE